MSSSRQHWYEEEERELDYHKLCDKYGELDILSQAGTSMGYPNWRTEWEKHYKKLKEKDAIKEEVWTTLK